MEKNVVVTLRSINDIDIEKNAVVPLNINQDMFTKYINEFLNAEFEYNLHINGCVFTKSLEHMISKQKLSLENEIIVHFSIIKKIESSFTLCFEDEILEVAKQNGFLFIYLSNNKIYKVSKKSEQIVSECIYNSEVQMKKFYCFENRLLLLNIQNEIIDIKKDSILFKTDDMVIEDFSYSKEKIIFTDEDLNLFIFDCTINKIETVEANFKDIHNLVLIDDFVFINSLEKGLLLMSIKDKSMSGLNNDHPIVSYITRDDKIYFGTSCNTIYIAENMKLKAIPMNLRFIYSLDVNLTADLIVTTDCNTVDVYNMKNLSNPLKLNIEDSCPKRSLFYDNFVVLVQGETLNFYEINL